LSRHINFYLLQLLLLLKWLRLMQWICDPFFVKISPFCMLPFTHILALILPLLFSTKNIRLSSALLLSCCANSLTLMALKKNSFMQFCHFFHSCVISFFPNLSRSFLSVCLNELIITFSFNLIIFFVMILLFKLKTPFSHDFAFINYANLISIVFLYLSLTLCA
jgi:hypothetical protein